MKVVQSPEMGMSVATASTADTAVATAPPPAPAYERKTYHAGTGRRFFFSFVFLILLPFFLSLPGMLFMRLKHGQLSDSIGLAIVAAAFGLIMFLLLIELMFTVRAKFDLGDDKVRMTLPSGRGPTPMLRYKSYEVPYDQIQAIETRREVYGGSLLPVLLQGARLILKDGSNIKLGYVSEACVDPAFPYPEIAREISSRARLPVIDRGNVRRSIKTKMLGIRSAPRAGGDLVEEKDIAELNRSHSNVMLGLIGGLVVLMAIGLVSDLTASEPVSRLPAPTAKHPAKAATGAAAPKPRQ